MKSKEIWETIRDRILARYLFVYFRHGWHRIAFAISLFNFLGILMLVFGLSFESLILKIAFFVLAGVLVIIPTTILGYLDYLKGTWKAERLRTFELSPIWLRIFDAIFDGLKAIAKSQGTKLPENTLKIAKWIKESRKKLGV